jgi:hypothetical protein
MKNTLLAVLAAGAILSAASLQAQSVSYVPSTETIQGTATTSFLLSVYGPANLAKNSKAVVSVAATNTAAPTGLTAATVAAGIKISPSSVTFTGPSQVASVTVTLTPPKATGTYQWLVLATGWPAAVTNPGCVVNLQELSNVKPVAAITFPSNGEALYVASTPFSLTLPLGFDATVASGGSPVTSATALISGPGLPSGGKAVTLTSSGLGTGSVVSDASFAITQVGEYTLTFTAVNAAGSTTTTALFNVGLPPTLAPITDQVVWQSPTTTTTFKGGMAVPVSFTVVNTVTSQIEVDKNIQVALYPVVSGYPGAVTLYSYSTFPTYSTTGSVYLVNWPTAAGTNHYRADVDLNVSYSAPSTGGTTVKLSSVTFNTQ